MVARKLARIHLIAVAAPTLLNGRRLPDDPSGPAELPGVVMRSPMSGRVRTPVMRNHAGLEVAAVQQARMLAVLLGLGVGLIPACHAMPYLQSGALVRLLPGWHGDIGAIFLYFTSKKLLPAKTRVFVGFVMEEFRPRKLEQMLSAQ
jgi:DNA-binding transcriptional LysR family regulator